VVRVGRRWEECEEKLKGALKFIKGTIYKPYFTDPVPAQPNTTAKPTHTLPILQALPDSLPRNGF